MLEIEKTRAPNPIVAVAHKPDIGSEFGQRLFFALLAAYFIYASIHGWMSVTGMTSAKNARFDQLSPSWQTMMVILCVARPIVALGLWGRFSWGIVVWIITAGVEIAMHTVFASTFASAPMLVAFHVVMLAIFAFATLSKRIIPNKK